MAQPAAAAGTAGKRICVLSIDGGGVRGIIPSTILEFLENELKGPNGEGGVLADYFDVIAGTSTGGLVTAMLTVPEDIGSRKPKYSAQDVSQTYLEKAHIIFPHRKLPHHPKYDGKDLKTTVTDLLQEHWHLEDTLTNVVIPAFDIATQEPVFFSNLEAQRDPLANPPLAQVCLATSAAPTYLPPIWFTTSDESSGKPEYRKYNLVDGGVVCNNPAHVAVTQAIRELGPKGNAYKKRIEKWKGYQEFLLLSLGTGNTPVSYDAEEASKWRNVQWAHPLVDIFSNGSSDLVDYNLAGIFQGSECPQNYLRIQTDSVTTAMDDSDEHHMTALVQIAKDLLDQQATYRDQLTGKLVPRGDKLTNREHLKTFAHELKKERAARH